MKSLISTVKYCIAGIVLTIALTIPVSLGCSNLPEKITVMYEAEKLDSILEREWNDRHAIMIANSDDNSYEINRVYSADELLDVYYTDKDRVKEILRRMRTRERTEVLKSVINIMADIMDVNPHLAKGMAKKESHYNPMAKSPKGAVGIMQLMPGTAKKMGVTDRYNAIENIEGGLKYMKILLKKYKGNVKLALAAYNAGPGKVRRYRGIPPYKETRNYVKNVLKYKRKYAKHAKTIR